jgi:tripartite-type tricarboxylate transporter receptor subunit TctC
MHRRTFVSGSCALAAAAPFGRAGAQVSVTRFVFPFSAGGGGDALCRALADKIGPALGRTVIVENRTGADGRIAINSVKAAAPDGTTILITTGPTMWLLPLVHKAPGFDPYADFAPIAQLASFEFCVAVSNASGLKSMAELAAWAKANPDKATYAIPSVGTIPHFTGVALGKLFGVDMKRLAYRGGAPAINDLVGGQIPLSVGTLADALQQHRGGNLRILAVASEKRSPFAPAIPTLKESGFDIVGDSWYGMWAPKGTPADVVSAYHKAAAAALADAGVLSRLETLGLVPSPSTPERLTALMKDNAARWAPIIAASGYRMEN